MDSVLWAEKMACIALRADAFYSALWLSFWFQGVWHSVAVQVPAASLSWDGKTSRVNSCPFHLYHQWKTHSGGKYNISMLIKTMSQNSKHKNLMDLYKKNVFEESGLLKIWKLISPIHLWITDSSRYHKLSSFALGFLLHQNVWKVKVNYLFILWITDSSRYTSYQVCGAR